MLLGLAKGKIGDLVFYRDGGEQRTRSRVIPKNPRTPAQMAQRVKMANVSALYRTLSPILASSFSSRPSNQSGFNAFSSAAIGLAPYQTKEMATANVVLPQPAFASKGVLPTFPQSGRFTGASPFGVYVGSAVSGSSVTIAALSAALIEEYPALQYGDKLTFVGVRFIAADDQIGGIDVYTTETSVVTLELSASSTETLESADLVVTEGVLQIDMFTTLAEDEIGMGTVIHSRVSEGGQLQTSSQMFQLTPPAQSLYEGYRTAQSLNDAVQSYMAGSESILR